MAPKNADRRKRYAVRCRTKEEEIGMGQFVKVGTTAELEDLEGGKLVEAGGRSIAVQPGRQLLCD